MFTRLMMATKGASSIMKRSSPSPASAATQTAIKEPTAPLECADTIAHSSGDTARELPSKNDENCPQNQRTDLENEREGEDSAPLAKPAPSMRWRDLLQSIPGHVDKAVPNTRTDATSAETLLSLMQSSSSPLIPPPVEREQATQPADDYSSDDERETTGDGISHDGASSDAGHSVGSKPRKKRKSTHTVRKEEKATLVDEIQSLEERLAFLRGQVFAPVRDQHGEIVQPAVSNQVLRQAIHEQHLRFAAARSMVSQFISHDLTAPLHRYLHLGPDMAERRAVLLALKPEILSEARRFVEERSKFHDLYKQHASVERFVTSTGDACCLRFYVDQFPNTFTVRNIHDATSYFTSNLEMTITESIGHITIREDDDSGDPSLAQHRLAVAARGIVIDTNTVVFSHYNEQENYGILAATYVDEDDLHPYRPYERVRQDVTAVSLITQEQDAIVVRRWGYLRMRHSDHVKMPLHVLQMTRESLGHWGEAMMQYLRERLHHMMSAASSRE